VATFAEHVASDALTSEFATERRRLEGRIECLRAQHTEAVRDKSAAENKSRKMKEKLTAAEAEKEDLSCQLAAEKEDANKACAEAQAARAEAKLARAEANLAIQHAVEAEANHSSLRRCLDRVEASTHTKVDREHVLLVDVYRLLGARTAPF
jgi:chromosome segregation ATPase